MKLFFYYLAIRSHRNLQKPYKWTFQNVSSNALFNVSPINKAKKLFFLNDNEKDPLYLLFTGDTQYHFFCTDENIDCKKQSANCIAQYYDFDKSSTVSFINFLNRKK